MSLLESIESGPEQLPPRLLVYGTEGIGKSTLAANAPNPVFIPTEDGLGQIDCHRFPLATSLEQVQRALTELAAQEHDFETLVIDSLDWLERLVWDELCRRHSVPSIEKVDGGFGKGYTHALSSWRPLLSQLDRLRTERDMAIILIAHAKTERFEDPESSAYDRYSPRLNRHASALVCEWSDAVLFATRKVRTETEDAGFNRTRTIAHPIGGSGGDRVLRCVGSPACVAKNRFNLPDELPLSWPALMTAMTHSNHDTDGENNG